MNTEIDKTAWDSLGPDPETEQRMLGNILASAEKRGLLSESAPTQQNSADNVTQSYEHHAKAPAYGKHATTPRPGKVTRFASILAGAAVFALAVTGIILIYLASNGNRDITPLEDAPDQPPVVDVDSDVPEYLPDIDNEPVVTVTDDGIDVSCKFGDNTFDDPPLTELPPEEFENILDYFDDPQDYPDTERLDLINSLRMPPDEALPMGFYELVMYNLAYDMWEPYIGLTPFEIPDYVEDNLHTHLAMRWPDYHLAEIEKLLPGRQIISIDSIDTSVDLDETGWVEGTLVVRGTAEIRFTTLTTSTAGGGVNGVNVSFELVFDAFDKIVAIDMVFAEKYRDMQEEIERRTDAGEALTIELIDSVVDAEIAKLG